MDRYKKGQMRQTNIQKDGQVDGQTQGRTDETDKQTEGRTDFVLLYLDRKHTCETDKWMDRHKKGQMRQTYKQKDGRTNGWTDTKRTDETNRRADGQVDRQTEEF